MAYLNFLIANKNLSMPEFKQDNAFDFRLLQDKAISVIALGSTVCDETDMNLMRLYPSQ